MVLWKIMIVMVIAIVGFTQLPQSTQDDILTSGKKMVEDVLNNEPVLEALNSTESNSTENTELEKIYMGKITATIDIDCESDSQCKEVYGEEAICEYGECYVYQ